MLRVLKEIEYLHGLAYHYKFLKYKLLQNFEVLIDFFIDRIFRYMNSLIIKNIIRSDNVFELRLFGFISSIQSIQKYMVEFNI